MMYRMSTATEAQPGPTTLRQRAAAALPIGIALLLIAAVWLCGAVWSFEEQTRLARELGFETPELLPLTLDGMAVAMAAVAYAASLDARPAVYARLITAVSIGASAASNASAAWRRSGGDEQTVILAAGVAVAAMLAFEVLLGEVRRQVLRRRGQPGPAAITYPRLVRLALAPWPTFTSWRKLVLTATDPALSFGPQPPIRAEVIDESDPGIQIARRLTREMAAARQSIAPRVARLALAERAVGTWAPAPVREPLGEPVRRAVAAAPEPVREPVPAAVEPAREPVREPATGSPDEPTDEPATGSRKTTQAAHAPARQKVTERVTSGAKKAAAADTAKKLSQAHARLTRRLKREPTNPELAEEASVSLATVKRWKSDRANAQKES